MKIETQKEADAYFEDCVQHCMSHFGKNRKEAESIEKTNLGYCAGYYDNEVRERVEKLFRCEHPIFGSIKKSGPPSAEDAFEMGIQFAKKTKQNAN